VVVCVAGHKVNSVWGRLSVVGVVVCGSVYPMCVTNTNRLEIGRHRLCGHTGNVWSLCELGSPMCGHGGWAVCGQVVGPTEQ